MNKIKCLIVDDEELARKLLETYIEQVPQLELVKKCKNPLEAIEFVQSQVVDLLFLDIHMPQLSGIDFLKSLSHKPNVILTTAYKEYALESYRLDVIDYLVKPIEFSLFLQAVNKGVERIRLKQKTPEKTVVVSVSKEKDYILVKSEHRLIRLLLKDILYIQGMNEYVSYHTENERIMSLYSLKKLEEELPKEGFIRIHKSYIVSISKVAALEGNMVHIADKKLPIGGSYKQEVIRKIFG